MPSSNHLERLSIHELLSLYDCATQGALSESHLTDLIDQLGCTSLGESLLTYRYTRDVESLRVTPSSAFKAVVYHADLAVGAPVMSGGQIVPSPSTGSSSLVPLIFTRPLLFDDVLVMYWQDDPVVRLEFDDGTIERVMHAPLLLHWSDRYYQLLCESQRKSWYWPTDVSLPPEIEPWLGLLPQHRTDLATGLKRQGLKLDAFTGIALHPDQIFDEDWGVWVMTSDVIQRLTVELGVSAEASQVTVWFLDGSFFKGSILSSDLSGLVPGVYGGLKRPQCHSSDTIRVTRGSIMDNYIQVPWTPSLNRQQCDYASMVLPVRTTLPSQESFAKAATGFPAYIDSLNTQLIASAAKLFQKIEVRGVAGKVTVGVLDEDVQFIVRGPHEHHEVKEMAFLFNPTLPVHTSVMCVKVAFIRDETLGGRLIQVNVAECNRDWVNRWYIQYAGRDMDGDGFTLSDDPIVLEHAVSFTNMKWFDTTQFKSVVDAPADDGEMSLRTATERIRKYSGRVGIYDKLARRIYRHDPALLTWELRVLLTEAIQRSISAQKKNSGADKFEGYNWLMQHLPADASEWLFNNEHDAIDALGDAARSFLHVIQRDVTCVSKVTQAKTTLLESLAACEQVMPEHHAAALDLLSMVQTVTPDSFHQIRERGRRLWAKYQARSNDDVSLVLDFIVKSKHMWCNVRSVYDDSELITYPLAARIIGTWATQLTESVPFKLLLGAMLSELSLSLLGKILTVLNLESGGILGGRYLPVCVSSPPTPGQVGSGSVLISMLAHPAFSSALNPERKYVVTSVYENTAANWIVPRSQLTAQSNYIIKLKEVQS